MNPVKLKPFFIVRGTHGELHVNRTGGVEHYIHGGSPADYPHAYSDITQVDLGRLFKEDPGAEAVGECDILDIGYWYKKNGFTKYEEPMRERDADGLRTPSVGPSFISIDIETLDTAPTAVILSIGIAVVTNGELLEDHDLSAGDVFPQLMQGRTISEDTVDWWRDLKQYRARKYVETAGSLFESLQELTKVLKEYPDLKIWARGPQFDQVLLEHAYRQHNLPIPWKYNQWRDERTLEALFPNAPELPWPENRIPHVAVDDAWYQAQRVLQLHTLLPTQGTAS